MDGAAGAFSTSRSRHGGREDRDGLQDAARPRIHHVDAVERGRHRRTAPCSVRVAIAGPDVVRAHSPFTTTSQTSRSRTLAGSSDQLASARLVGPARPRSVWRNASPRAVRAVTGQPRAGRDSQPRSIATSSTTQCAGGRATPSSMPASARAAVAGGGSSDGGAGAGTRRPAASATTSARAAPAPNATIGMVHLRLTAADRTTLRGAM